MQDRNALSLSKEQSALNQRLQPQVAYLTSDLSVLIGTSTLNVRTWIARTYSELAAYIGMRGGEVPFTEEELLKYFMTGVRSRIARVNFESPRFPIDVRGRWAMPLSLASIIATIGVVELHRPAITAVPVWAGDNKLVLSEEEWHALTPRIRSIRDFGFEVASALEARAEGLASVMTLVPLIVNGQTRRVNMTEFTAADAIFAAVLDVHLDVDTATLVSSNPLWHPPFYVDEQEVLRYIPQFAEMRHKGFD